MAELNIVAINAESADQTSAVLDTSRMDNLFLQVTATVTAATLSATVAVGTGIEPGSPAALPTVPVVAISTLPSGISLVSGVLTFATAAIGTHTILLKLAEPAPASIVTYDYTSGGGTVSMIVRAFGWKHST